MLNNFLKFCENQQLFSKTDIVLLTVSGGRDSVAMVHLFKAAKFNFAIAHCNFNLRGKESDKDEKFVKKMTKDLDVQFYSKSFKTIDFAEQHKISTQMAARQLRYNWFEELCAKHNFDYIATAHHKNDVAETVLINLTKGTGLSGLHGIAVKNGKIIRPLLCFNRAEIDKFIDENKIEFREDLSNKETKYVRNKIRHKVIQELEKINPSFIETIYNETQQFNELEQLLEQKINDDRLTCVEESKDVISINIDKLSQLKPIKTYLYYFLKPYGFNYADVSNILDSLDKQSGKKFFSPSHQLIKDRKTLIVNPIKTINDKEFVINSIKEFEKLALKIKAEISFSKTIKKDKKIACLDADKINYPLVLRKWKNGDKFKPFGMKNSKKLSDFFIDEKLSLVEKENTWLLTQEDNIIWVVGHRIHDDFKITSQTKSSLFLALNQ